MRNVIALAIADIHLSLTPPGCRAEKDWLEVQAHYLDQVNQIVSRYNVRILCAGDVFDKWNPPPELIRFALEHLPTGMICVPGQHDLPNHRIDQMNRSGYGVLKQAQKIIDIAGSSWSDELFQVNGFGWGQPITPSRAPEGKIKIALIHRYLWVEGKSYPDAPSANKLPNMKDELKGYDWAIFGDNHQGFIANTHPGEDLKHVVKVINCGPLFRRRVDEIFWDPKVWLITDGNAIKSETLDTKLDKFSYTETADKTPELDMADFIERLEQLGDMGLDFPTLVKRHLENEQPSQAVRDIILSVLNKG